MDVGVHGVEVRPEGLDAVEIAQANEMTKEVG